MADKGNVKIPTSAPWDTPSQPDVLQRNKRSQLVKGRPRGRVRQEMPHRISANASEDVALTRRVGTVGWLRRSGTAAGDSLIIQDPNPEWEPHKARGLVHDHGTILRMTRTDSVIRGGLLSTTELFRTATLTVNPPIDPTMEEGRATEFAVEQLDMMEGGVDGLLESAAYFMPYGFWLLEILLEQRDSPKWGPHLALQSLEDRVPWSIYSWMWDARERLTGVIQRTQECHDIQIPIEKCLLFTHGWPEGGPEGVSQLRSAFFAWVLKQDVFQRYGAIVDRYGFGTIHSKQTERDVGADILDDHESRMSEYACEPNGYLLDAWGIDTDFEYPAGSAPDPTPIIRLLNQEILISFLAMFLLHGAVEVGTRNVTAEHLAFFRDVMQNKVDYVASVVGRRGRPGSGLLPKIIDLNFATGPGFRYPTVEATGIAEQNISRFINDLSTAVGSGLVVLEPGLQKHVREKLVPNAPYEVQDIESDDAVEDVAEQQDVDDQDDAAPQQETEE